MSPCLVAPVIHIANRDFWNGIYQCHGLQAHRDDLPTSDPSCNDERGHLVWHVAGPALSSNEFLGFGERWLGLVAGCHRLIDLWLMPPLVLSSELVTGHRYKKITCHRKMGLDVGICLGVYVGSGTC